MPRVTRRRQRRSLKKKQKQKQNGGQLVNELAMWVAGIKNGRTGDPRTLTFANLAEISNPIGDRLVITTPYYPNLTVGDAVSHLRVYLGAYFESPASYTMEEVRSRLAESATGEDNLSYIFLSNVEAALSGKNTVDISNIQNYPLLAFYLVVNSEQGDPLKPILMQEEPVVPTV